MSAVVALPFLLLLVLVVVFTGAWAQTGWRR